MDKETAVNQFNSMLAKQPDISPAFAALSVLLEFLKQDDSKTVQGLSANIRTIVDALMRVDSVVTSVKSASELFLRFITLTSLDHSDFNECKKVLSERGDFFLGQCSQARLIISKLALRCIRDNMNILVHSHSRVVFDALLNAHNKKRNFHVYVTESAPDYSGKLMYEKLQKAGIDCTLIIDAAVSYIMERMSVVLLGAEGVAENGGIINKIGTYGIAILAKAMHKKVYILAESFKFVRIFPANQRDLPNELSQLNLEIGPLDKALIDYTPPAYIDLLLTNLGILTTEAVTDEFIKLYM